MGVGSEVYSAVRAGRRGIGAELKASYYRQMVKNLHAIESEAEAPTLFGLIDAGADEQAEAAG